MAHQGLVPVRPYAKCDKNLAGGNIVPIRYVLARPGRESRQSTVQSACVVKIPSAIVADRIRKKSTPVVVVMV
jgi:hypothetical protein